MKHIHGGDLVSYQRQYPDTPALDFSANINPLGLPRGVRQALVDSAEACTHYPDPHCRELRAALSKYEDVPQEWILCGNVASDLISRIALGLRPQTALLLAPTFSEYEQALRLSGCKVQYHMLSEETDFRVDVSILEKIDGGIVFLCNPNNPTGALIAPALLDKIRERCAKTGAILAVDECFLDFTPDNHTISMKRYLGASDSLIILRAFTKIFAIPGLRLGYVLCGNPDILDTLTRIGSTWSVSVPAQLCGVAAAAETEYLAETYARLPVWRNQLAAGLERLGCGVYPSATNFLFFKARTGLARELLPHGILLRDCSNFYGLAQGYYRTAVRTEAENERLLRALRAVIE